MDTPRTPLPCSRRRFLAGAAAGAATLPFFTHAAARGQESREASTSESGSTDLVFRHSVASGDPLPNAVVLWTRVTPVPEATPGSGAGEPTTVRWEVATTPDFAAIAASGEVLTDAARDHTVTVDAQGLAPATSYFYRFTVLDGPAQGATSRTGRTRTAPAANASPDNLRFAVCACSNYEAGFFNAYREIASREDLEFVLHLGDFTYEYASGRYGAAFGHIVREVAPAHRTTSLTDFRVRQGHYHEDPDLADMLAAKPLVAMWDDHEFTDNAWGNGATGNSFAPGEDFPALKAAAMQAYFEWMPVRAGVGQGAGQGAEPPSEAAESGQDTRHVYRHLAYGQLAEIILPDLRSYRDYQVLYAGAGGIAADPDYLRAVGRDERSMMGRTQFDWFADVLTTSTTRWQLVGNAVMFAPLTLPATLDPQVHDWLVTQTGLPADGIALNADQWDGYMAERQRIIDLIAEHDLGGVVFLTGDIHSSWASDIPQSAGDYRLGRNGKVVATEFVTPSVTAASLFDTLARMPELSDAIRQLIAHSEEALRQFAPWHKYVELSEHGYLAVDVTAERVRADFHHGPVTAPNAPLALAASYQAIHGSPGATPLVS